MAMTGQVAGGRGRSADSLARSRCEHHEYFLGKLIQPTQNVGLTGGWESGPGIHIAPASSNPARVRFRLGAPVHVESGFQGSRRSFRRAVRRGQFGGGRWLAQWGRICEVRDDERRGER